MKQEIEAVNMEDDEGRPAGGYVEGVGIRIDWQEGPLVLTASDEHTCGCGAKATWRYDLRLKQATHLGYVPSEQIAYCDEHGPNTPPRREPNGAFVETVIAAALQRIEHYQSSQFRCRENALAITKLEEALHWLNARTARRAEAGTEGTHQGN